MKLKKEEIKKIADLVLQSLKTGSLIEGKVDDARVTEKVEALLFKNMEEEVAIEDEVKKIMEQYRSQIASGSIDPQKAYTMIKKQVAKDRKFIL